MPQNVFHDVTPINGGGRGLGCGRALFSSLIGVILMVIGVFTLFTNEREAVMTARALDQGSRIAVTVNSAAFTPANNGRLIHTVGMAQGVSPVADPVFKVWTPGLKLKRAVKMYQWAEESSEETEYALTGSRKITTYRYSTGWSSDPIDSNAFAHPAGHKNPPMRYGSLEFTAIPTKCGVFDLSANLINQIGGYRPLSMSTSDCHLIPHFVFDNGGLYRGRDSAQPHVGDVKITYSYVPASTVTVVARQKGHILTAYHVKSEGDVELLRVGKFDSAHMFGYARHQNSERTWDGRLLGFIFLSFGLMLASQLFLALFQWIPFLGDAMETLGCVASLGMGMVLSLLTIAAGWFYYRPVETGLLVAGGVVVIIAWLRSNALRRRNPA